MERAFCFGRGYLLAGLWSDSIGDRLCVGVSFVDQGLLHGAGCVLVVMQHNAEQQTAIKLDHGRGAQEYVADAPG